MVALQMSVLWALLQMGVLVQACEDRRVYEPRTEMQAQGRAERPAEVVLLDFSFWEQQQRCYGWPGHSAAGELPIEPTLPQ